MENFYVGMRFNKPVPVEAISWCNLHGCRIESTGNIRTIVQVKPTETSVVRTFSKFSIWSEAQQLEVVNKDGSKDNAWTAFEKFLTSTTLPSGVPLISGWMQLNEISEDSQLFKEFYPVACDKLGRDLVDKILERAVISVNCKQV